MVVPIRANTGEHVNVSREDSMARVADALERQNQLLEEQNALLRDVAESSEDTSDYLEAAVKGNASFATRDAA